MGIFGALTTAVTGMRAQSFSLENISGNIANSQTTGYKETTTFFEDLVSAATLGTQTANGVTAGSRSNILRAMARLAVYIDADVYLVMERPLDVNLVKHVGQLRGAVEDYVRLEGQRSSVQGPGRAMRTRAPPAQASTSPGATVPRLATPALATTASMRP